MPLLVSDTITTTSFLFVLSAIDNLTVLTMYRVNKAISGGRNKSEKRQLKVSEARPLLEEGESERLINQDTVSPAAPHLPASLTAYTRLTCLWP